MRNHYINIDNPPELERALTLAVKLPDKQAGAVKEELSELNSLARTAGLDVIESQIVYARKINPAYFVGKGKAGDLSALCEVDEISAVIVNDELSPAQVRNLQEVCGCKVLDRTELILAIFAQRAQTREARLQVELAQLKYMLPRLVGCWKHLSRQEGGIGTKGPGEKQLEVDRRDIRNRIQHLERELLLVKKERATQRSQRIRSGIFTISLVGYTNSGKSTLLNTLTGSKAKVENKLFATLDPKATRSRFQSGHRVVFIDTVGFIRNLPHHLIESFSSTFEEARMSDLLLHVLDVSHPDCIEHAETSRNVLKKLGASAVPVIMVYNKLDRVSDPLRPDFISSILGTGIGISAKLGTCIDKLIQAIEEMLDHTHSLCVYTCGHDNHALIHFLHEHTAVMETEYRDDTIYITTLVRKEYIPRIKKLLKK